MYAVIVTGGKQYKVSEGDVLFIEKLDAAEGDSVKFDKVLAIGGENTVIGTP
ncbi:MAG: 50S ribosomal protein L21, partial [Clostridia bacterium]|nr:50S ribosomal protein L21 [Clostridia bacterium]